MITIPKWVWILPVAFIGYKLYKKVSTTDNITFPDTTVPGGVVRNQIVNTMVSKLYEVTEATLYLDGSDRCKAYEDYYKMANDSEFVTVANVFKKTYKKTLRQAMFNTNYSGCSYFSTQWDDKVTERMDKLNIP